VAMRNNGAPRFVLYKDLRRSWIGMATFSVFGDQRWAVGLELMHNTPCPRVGRGRRRSYVEGNGFAFIMVGQVFVKELGLFEIEFILHEIRLSFVGISDVSGH